MGKNDMPCIRCGGNKWQTVKKGKLYKCRQMVYDEVKGGPFGLIKTRKLIPCGYIKEVK